MLWALVRGQAMFLAADWWLAILSASPTGQQLQMKWVPCNITACCGCTVKYMLCLRLCCCIVTLCNAWCDVPPTRRCVVVSFDFRLSSVGWWLAANGGGE
jgi:hypothetical protein